MPLNKLEIPVDDEQEPEAPCYTFTLQFVGYGYTPKVAFQNAMDSAWLPALGIKDVVKYERNC